MPKNFANVWNDHVNSLGDISNVWDDTTSWTTQLLYKGDLFVKAIGKAYEPSISQLEYRKIDAVVFSKETFKKINYFDNSGCIADTEIHVGIEIAFEHENNFETAFEEIIKLTELRAKLKVLVTYPNTTQAEIALVEKFSKGIKQANEWFRENSESQYLLICGPKIKEEIEWTYYKFNTEGTNEKINL